MTTDEETVAVEHITDKLRVFDGEELPSHPVSEARSTINFAIVVHEKGCKDEYARVSCHDRTGFTSILAETEAEARETIKRRIRLWSTHPHDDECWAYHNNDDLSPTIDNTLLLLQRPYEGDFTQKEFFGQSSIVDFGEVA